MIYERNTVHDLFCALETNIRLNWCALFGVDFSSKHSIRYVAQRYYVMIINPNSTLRTLFSSENLVWVTVAFNYNLIV